MEDAMRESTRKMVLKVFPRARELRDRVRGTGQGSHGGPGLQAQVRRLEERVRVLEEEVQEARRLNKRVAELTDLVGEVLLPSSARDDEHVHARLQAFVERR
jgi:hypothetical protein